MGIVPPVGQPLVIRVACNFCKRPTPVQECYALECNDPSEHDSGEVPCCSECYTKYTR